MLSFQLVYVCFYPIPKYLHVRIGVFEVIVFEVIEIPRALKLLACFTADIYRS